MNRSKMDRRRRQQRRKRLERVRREDGLFFAHGTVPASARQFAWCPCGGSAFSRSDGHDLDEFDQVHAFCDWEPGVVAEPDPPVLRAVWDRGVCPDGGGPHYAEVSVPDWRCFSCSADLDVEAVAS